MEITNIEVYPLWASFADAFGGPHKVPQALQRPAYTMRNTPLGGQGAVIVKVHTREGITGIGEAMGRPSPRSTAALIEDVLKPMLIGQDATKIRVHWGAMFEATNWSPMALSGVDIALWDIAGKRHGVPVYQLLGGPFENSLDCYASPIPFLPTPEDSAEYVQSFLDKGFTAVKLKIGRGIREDMAHVEAVRDTIGQDTRLLVDANGGYTVTSAVQLARELVKQGVYWLEEPVAAQYVDALAMIRRQVDIPIATGEWLGSVYDFQRLIQSEAADVLMPNITRCGGITGLSRIAEVAEFHNVMIAPHGVGAGVGIKAVLQVLAAIPNFLIYEYNQLFNPIRHSILVEEIGLSNGRMEIPSTPGIDAEVADTVLQQFSVSADKV